MSPRFTVCAVTLLAVLIFAACGADSPRSGPDSGEPIFRFRIPSDPLSLDPIHSTDLVSQAVVNNLFETLVRLDPETGEVTSGIAVRWEVMEDGLAFRFHLRTDMHFHNGRRLNAHDVQYSFERLLSPASASPRPWVLMPIRGAADFRAGRTERVEGIVVGDDSTVVLHLERPYTPFLAQLTMTSAAVVPREGVERLGDDRFAQDPVGSGPFRFDSRQRDSWVRLSRFEGYAGGPPAIKSLEFTVIPSISVAIEKFAAGELDLLDDVPPGQVELAGRRFGDRLHIWSGLSVRFFGFNLTREPFRDNAPLRRAFNLAVNKRAITEVLNEGVGLVSTGPVPPGLPGHNPELDGYPFNMDRARELLAEAGYPGGRGLPEITLYYNTNPVDRRICEFVQACLSEIGVRIRLKSLEWAAFLAAIRAGEPELFRGSWVGDFPDAHNFLHTLFHSSNWGDPGNYARYANPEVDSLLDRAMRIADFGQREELYRRAEEIIGFDAPWIFLFHPGQVALVSPRWSGVRYPLVGVWAMPMKDVVPVKEATERR